VSLLIATPADIAAVPWVPERQTRTIVSDVCATNGLRVFLKQPRQAKFPVARAFYLPRLK
jgi:hypothetical protein